MFSWVRNTSAGASNSANPPPAGSTYALLPEYGGADVGFHISLEQLMANSK
jgi:hypothetical protein